MWRNGVTAVSNCPSSTERMSLFSLDSLVNVFNSIEFEFNWKKHETKIQLKSIFIDEFKIPFQPVHFTENGKTICLPGSDKDFLFSIYSSLYLFVSPSTDLSHSRILFEAYVHIRTSCGYLNVHGHKRIFYRPNNKSIFRFICLWSHLHLHLHFSCASSIGAKFSKCTHQNAWIKIQLNNCPIVCVPFFIARYKSRSNHLHHWLSILNYNQHTNTQLHDQCKHWTLMTLWYWCCQHINSTIFNYASILCIKVNQTTIKYHLCISKSLEYIGDDLKISFSHRIIVTFTIELKRRVNTKVDIDSAMQYGGWEEEKIPFRIH